MTKQSRDLGNSSDPGNPSDPSETPEILLDDPAADIEAAMRDALSAVEAVEADGPQAPQTSPAVTETPEAEAQDIESLRREIADLRDRSLRTLADFDNFRKRAERERQEVRRYALLEPLREFLPIADNLERALSAGGSAEDLKRGVELILRQMQELLRRFGVREVGADGEPFNPMVHEAVARIESDQVTVPTVSETLVRGYMLHDRLLRPAMVKVAVPPESAGSRPTQESSPPQSSDGGRDGGRGEPAI